LCIRQSRLIYRTVALTCPQLSPRLVGYEFTVPEIEDGFTVDIKPESDGKTDEITSVLLAELTPGVGFLTLSGGKYIFSVMKINPDPPVYSITLGSWAS
jgi:hypothetical protein